MLKYIGDFERLKEFGFVKTIEGYHWINYDIDIYIDDENIICFEIIMHEPYLIWENIPSVIYDLIKAGLVEKVEE